MTLLFYLPDVVALPFAISFGNSIVNVDPHRIPLQPILSSWVVSRCSSFLSLARMVSRRPPSRWFV